MLYLIGGEDTSSEQEGLSKNAMGLPGLILVSLTLERYQSMVYQLVLIKTIKYPKK
ncbi:TVG0954446 [Thermoplasma volcanium GSS1]|uniref:TVG0954446 protein n=1 Tax=Thermoplasma volcanium (strain ATCC 51530 / DSM 4299 / JCM 9571 / NBRC 15438 / GSS1) TaxID=273116 RepID=Q97A84_THEVO|nr:TVG0954446 [Thermoplasma volcanium GSS1]